MCEWFVDNKLSVHFEEDNITNITNGNNTINQFHIVEYFGCDLDAKCRIHGNEIS